MNPRPPADDPSIPFSRVAKFVRQVTHDLRNGLNAIDLEAAFIAEIVTDAEALDEAKKLRVMVGNVAKSLQHLADNFSSPPLHAIDIGARDFLAAFRERVEQRFATEAARLEWKDELGSENVEIDFEWISTALLELLQNAFQFGPAEAPVIFRASASGSEIVFEITEQRPADAAEPGAWGRDPLQSTRRGGYGLGLFRARRILEGHGGALTLRQQGEKLITAAALPVLTLAR